MTGIPRTLEAKLQLLDHQVIDVHGEMVCMVDDLELRPDRRGHLHVTAILTGPGALGPRWGGRFGSWITAVWRRLRDDADPVPGRIAWNVVTGVDSGIRLNCARADLAIEGLETWTDAHIVTRIPGAGHESDA